MVVPFPPQKHGIPKRDIRDMLNVSLNADGTLKEAAVEATASVSRLTHNVYDPDEYGAVRDDDEPATRAANVIAIQAAADDAESNDGVLVIKGTYHTDDTVQFRCHVDMTDGTIRVNDNTIAPAIRLGGNTGSSDRITNKTIRLGAVVQEDKASGAGWPGSDVGVEIANCYQCQIAVPYVSQFRTALRGSGYSTGSVCNHIFLGLLENSLVPLHLEPGDSGGWHNQNIYYLGRGTIDSREHDGVTPISGSRGLLIGPGTNSVNGNQFFGYSCEGNGFEYHIEIYGGNNRFEMVRPEVSGVNARIQINGPNAIANEFYGGFDMNNIDWTYANGATSRWNKWKTRGGEWIPGSSDTGALLVWNQSSNASPAITGLPVDANFASNPATDWLWQLAGNHLQGKRKSDDHPRAKVDFNAGSVSIGNGTTAPPHTLSPYGSIATSFSTMIRVANTGSLPSASSLYRRVIAYIEGAAGVADAIYVCRKNAADTYEWKEL